jgi:hypothetical protein
MARCVTKRFRLVFTIVLCALVVAILTTHAGRAVALASLVRVAEVSSKILRLSCWIVDHSKCFTPDRLDPTCPPYL